MPEGRVVASVTLRLPSLLALHAGGGREFTLQAATMGEALSAARAAAPGLRQLLDDERGRRRQHVNVFYNGVEEESIPDRDRPARDGDLILVIQAVSGGAWPARPPAPEERGSVVV